MQGAVLRSGRELANVQNLAGRPCLHIGSRQRQHRYHRPFGGGELDLIRLAMLVDVDNCADIALLKPVGSKRVGQHHEIKLLHPNLPGVKLGRL